MRTTIRDTELEEKLNDELRQAQSSIKQLQRFINTSPETDLTREFIENANNNIGKLTKFLELGRKAQKAQIESTLADQKWQQMMIKSIDPSYKGDIYNTCGGINKALADPIHNAIAQCLLSHASSVISLGCGEAWHEQQLSLQLEKSDCHVYCYDINDISNPHVLFRKKDLKTDPIETILPEDCSTIIVFAAYPQGCIGEVLHEYICRGGKNLIVVVEAALDSDMHSGYETSRSETGDAILIDLCDGLYDNDGQRKGGLKALGYERKIIGRQISTTQDTCLIWYGPLANEFRAAFDETNTTAGTAKDEEGKKAYCSSMISCIGRLFKCGPDKVSPEEATGKCTNQ